MKAASLLQSRRYGTFKLPVKFLEEIDTEVLNEALLGMIVTRCEYRFDLDCFEYVAYHPDFEVVEEGNEPFNYFLQIITVQDTWVTSTSYKWLKCYK